MNAFLRSSFVALIATHGLGCAGAAPRADGERSPAARSAPRASAPRGAFFSASCDRIAPDTGAAAIPGRHDGSAVALASVDGRAVAYVADPNLHAIHTVELASARLLATSPVAGAPRQLLVLGDGRVAATIEDEARLDVFEPGSALSDGLAQRCSRETPRLPWGLAEDEGGATVVVSSGWDAALTLFDGATLLPRRVSALPRAPRSVIVRGRAAYVSHLVGSELSVVDLDHDTSAVGISLANRKASPSSSAEERAATRTTSQGYALASVVVSPRPGTRRERVLAPRVTVDPGDAARPSQIYYGDPPGSIPKQAPWTPVVDVESNSPVTSFVLDTSPTRFTEECLLPRAAAVAQDGERLFVACMGIDEVVELDARAPDPSRAIRRRIRVEAGPSALAVADASDELVVYSELAAVVTVLPITGNRAPREISLAQAPRALDWQRGRQLFYATDDPRITSDGLTCSSCHPDGFEDGLTWRTPEGPRQTPMLAGRVEGSAPYGWTRNKESITGYVEDTMDRLGGQGLPKTDLDALVTFVSSLPSPVHATADDASIARGRELFSSERTDCQSCHPGGDTDRRGHLLDMSQANSYDTPSLRSVVATAPYFHDGRYPSLDALLSDRKSHMGRAFELSVADRRALRDYLESL